MLTTLGENQSLQNFSTKEKRSLPEKLLFYCSNRTTHLFTNLASHFCTSHHIFGQIFVTSLHKSFFTSLHKCCVTSCCNLRKPWLAIRGRVGGQFAFMQKQERGRLGKSDQQAGRVPADFWASMVWKINGRAFPHLTTALLIYTAQSWPLKTNTKTKTKTNTKTNIKTKQNTF